MLSPPTGLRPGPAPLTLEASGFAQQAFFVAGPLADLPADIFCIAYSSGMLANHSR
jgi:hypothetical protein